MKPGNMISQAIETGKQRGPVNAILEEHILHDLSEFLKYYDFLKVI